MVEYMRQAAEWLWRPIADTPWGAWREFWLTYVTQDRHLILLFLPLTLILLAASRRRMREAIVITALLWLSYVFGPLYALLWLGACCVFYLLGERFASECRRADIPLWKPAAAVAVLVVLWWVGNIALARIRLPEAANQSMLAHAAWLYPYGARGWSWEPWWIDADLPGPGAPPNVQLLGVIFVNLHNIGVAYLMVRLLHYYAEIRRGGISEDRRGLLNFLAWVCYAPTLMQGPIERYPRFHDELATCHERRTWRNVPPAAARMAWGVAKNLLVIWYFVPPPVDTLGMVTRTNPYYRAPHTIDSYAYLYLGVYAQIYALYLQFSGYCDVSAGIARLLGIRQVENFDWPWLATSMRDFWHRWHISLSTILRDYLYIPLGGNRRHVALNLCVTFAICGLWHFPLPHMAGWGVLMGLMLAVNQRWAGWCKSLDERPASRLAAVRRAARNLRPLPSMLSWALTMHCFVMSLLLFFGGTGGLKVAWELIRRPLNAVAGSEWLSPWI